MALSVIIKYLVWLICISFLLACLLPANPPIYLDYGRPIPAIRFIYCNLLPILSESSLGPLSGGERGFGVSDVPISTSRFPYPRSILLVIRIPSELNSKSSSNDSSHHCHSCSDKSHNHSPPEAVDGKSHDNSESSYETHLFSKR